MTSLPAVDFLIVTALDVERDAVEKLLENPRRYGDDIVGTIPRYRLPANQLVALITLAGMGSIDARKGTMRALKDYQPKHVILTGICAGFHERDVELGDVLVPFIIAPYEMAKIKEAMTSEGKMDIIYEHRGMKSRVSFMLWQAANEIRLKGITNWVELIDEPRPDTKTIPPNVHSREYSVFGCGDKVVSAEDAEPRKWLLNESKYSIGLDMEASGAQDACFETDTPFAVVKAVQDNGTADKDKPEDRDLWRPYAAQAAAAFTYELIHRFELPSDPLFIQHMKDVRDAVNWERRYLDELKAKFDYTVSTAQFVEDLRQGRPHLAGQSPSVLIPHDTNRNIVLHGGGGTGKSTIIRSIFVVILERDLCPVLINLKQYIEPATEKDAHALASHIICLCSSPQRTLADLRKLSHMTRLTLMIDGFNEIKQPERDALNSQLREMREAGGNCFVLIADRSDSTDLGATYTHAMVDRLTRESVRLIFNSNVREKVYEDLDPELQEIYCRPFFLSLAIRTGKSFTGARLWSSIFVLFFRDHLGIQDEKLGALASLVLDSLVNSIPVKSQFAEFNNIRPDLYSELVTAEVIRDDGSYEHHLWRDFLASHALAQQSALWNEDGFDAVTTLASSLESITLTVEQLPTQEQKHQFLQKVFDWNLSATARSVANLGSEEGEDARRIGREVRIAVLAAVAEKRFDPVQHTRLKANELLKNLDDDLARQFLGAETRGQIADISNAVVSSQAWFTQWKDLFAINDGEMNGIDIISSDDAILGWASANTARRVHLTNEQQEALRNLYRSSLSDDSKKTIRWRIVHVLGAHPSGENTDLLCEALNDDAYRWVRYGAARALVETAAKCDAELKTKVLSQLQEFIRSQAPENESFHFHALILKEIIETSFMQTPNQGWRSDMLPILELIPRTLIDTTYAANYQNRVLEFADYSGD